MTTNPFASKPPAKKHIITVSLTAEQDEAFETLKKRIGMVTDGAVIKKALEHYIDWLDREAKA